MADKAGNDVTGLLAAAGRGDRDAVAQLADVIYGELRRLAHAILRHDQPHQTLHTTALVNEAWMRLTSGREIAYENSTHFYRAAARAMRTILIDYARARCAHKRGAAWKRTPLDNLFDAVEVDRIDLIALDQAMTRLEALSPRRSQVVELRFFAGLSIEQTARVLGVSHGTIENDWHFARLWLHRAIEGDQP